MVKESGKNDPGIMSVQVLIRLSNSIGSGSKTDEELRPICVSNISLNPVNPTGKGHVVTSVAIVGIVDTSTCGAVWSVVELDVQVVESGLCESVSKIAIRNDTLRGSSQKHRGIVGIHVRSELISHSTVSTTTTTLDIEVETVNAEVTERARTSVA